MEQDSDGGSPAPPGKRAKMKKKKNLKHKLKTASAVPPKQEPGPVAVADGSFGLSCDFLQGNIYIYILILQV